jgi:RsiW-degrading membrane proteinase PrsW (M82 family)
MRGEFGFCLVMGGIMGGACAYVESSVMPHELLENPEFYIIIGAVGIAPVVEELLKPIGPFLYLNEQKDFPLMDWILMGFFSGLGFKIFEDAVYVLGARVISTQAAVDLLILRNLFPIHLIATSIAAYGIGMWSKTGKRAYFVCSILTSALIHSLYNTFAVIWSF